MVRTAQPIQIVVQESSTAEVLSRFVLSDDDAKGILGRSTDCAVVVPEESVSRMHAVLIRKDGVLKICDLQSTNGTRVNGQLLSNEMAQLQSGSLVVLGSATVRISYEIWRDPTEFDASGEAAGNVDYWALEAEPKHPARTATEPPRSNVLFPEGSHPVDLTTIEKSYYRKRNEGNADIFDSKTLVTKPPPAEPEANSVLLETVDECPFCTFVRTRVKERQTSHEDEEIIVILDDHPIAHGHSLVILKSHYRDLTCVPPEQAARLGAKVARVATALKRACNAEVVYVASLGEQVRHVHYHLIPRYERDTKGFSHFVSPRGRLTTPEPIVARIKAELTLVPGW